MSLLARQPGPGRPRHCPCQAGQWVLTPQQCRARLGTARAQLHLGLCLLPLASLCLWLEPLAAPCLAPPTPSSTPQSLGPHLPLNMCLHHLLGLHSGQGPIFVPQPPSSRGPISVPQPHLPGAHLCASGPPLSQGSPLLRLPRHTASLLSPSCPTLSWPPTASGPSVSISISGCWVLTSCPAHLLPPFLGARLFTVGRAEDPRGTAFPARLLESSGGTRLQWW